MKNIIVLSFVVASTLTACRDSEDGATLSEQLTPSDPDPDSPEYWVEVYEGNQAAHSYDFLLNCWADQWPGDVKAQENAPTEALATSDDKANAIALTRENCTLEIMIALDQIKIDLAREGVPVSEIEEAAHSRLEMDLDGMFDEYWSRL